MDVRGADLGRLQTTKRAPFGVRVRNNPINNKDDLEWYNSGYCISAEGTDTADGELKSSLG